MPLVADRMVIQVFELTTVQAHVLLLAATFTELVAAP